jgi:hypothetical protein
VTADGGRLQRPALIERRYSVSNYFQKSSRELSQSLLPVVYLIEARKRAKQLTKNKYEY